MGRCYYLFFFMIKTTIFSFCAFSFFVASAFADTYSCKVYCRSGSTYANVSASSSSDAANQIDSQADSVCRNAGLGNATSSTMSGSQCSRR